jgi:hypothetical protein
MLMLLRAAKFDETKRRRYENELAKRAGSKNVRDCKKWCSICFLKMECPCWVILWGGIRFTYVKHFRDLKLGQDNDQAGVNAVKEQENEGFIVMLTNAISDPDTCVTKREKKKSKRKNQKCCAGREGIKR